MAFNNETYFSTAITRKFKLLDNLTTYPIEAWVSAGPLTTQRETSISAGTVYSGLIAGGANQSDVPQSSTELSSGDFWFTHSATLALGANKYCRGCGVVNAALSAGGTTGGIRSSSETFNGNTWSAQGNMSVARYEHSLAGISSSAVATGGDTTGTGSMTTSTDKFNGSTWSATAANIVGIYRTGGAGTQNSMLLTGGRQFPSNSGTTVFYFNGSAWSLRNSLLGIRDAHGTFGTSYNSLVVGGFDSLASSLSSCEKFNGSVFSSSINYLANAYFIRGDGTGNAAFVGSSNNTTGVIEGSKTTSRYLSSPAISVSTLFKGESSQLIFGGDFVASDAGYYVLDTGLAGNSSSNGSEYLELATLAKINDPGNRGIWSAGSALPAVRQAAPGAGTANAALAIGGVTIAVSLATVLKYDGSAWSSTGSLAVARAIPGVAGTQNASWCAGGGEDSTAVYSSTELFNGTTWSSSGALAANRWSSGFAGVKNAGIVFGGTVTVAQSPTIGTSEVFNGSTWSSAAALSSINQAQAGMGSRYAALSAGGILAQFEKFNGSAWSTFTSSLQVHDGAPSGTGSAGLARIIGGTGPAASMTEKYNGVVWSLNGALATLRRYSGAAGSADASLAFGGQTTPGGVKLSSTEKFSVSIPDIAFAAQGSWSSAANYPTNIQDQAGCGNTSAFICAGGATPGITNAANKFNGLSWASASTLSASKDGLSGAGSQASALAICGSSGGATVATTEAYNGTAWSTTGSVNTPTRFMGACGASSAALKFGGRDNSPAMSVVAEKFNGTTWSATGSLTIARGGVSGCGTQSAALVANGWTTHGSYSTNIFSAETFNGTVWTTEADLPVGRANSAGSGTQTSAMVSHGAGFSGAASVNTIRFNGLSWYVASSNSVARYETSMGSCGDSASIGALVVGGQTGSGTIATVESYLQVPAGVPTFAKYSVDLTQPSSAPVSTFIVATGGVVTTVGNDKIHTFNSNDVFEILSCPANATIQGLVVGAGGGGGSLHGAGGGGGGGVLSFSSYPVTAKKYQVVIGLGGIGALYNGSGVDNYPRNGQDSAFADKVAGGGGFGGGNGQQNDFTGRLGGSGGGGGGISGVGSGGGGTALSGQGNSGGTGNAGSFSHGGGGGGAGGSGGSGNDGGSGSGGAGIASSITGTSFFYAGGGGGAGDFTGSAGTGGSGGGGGGMGLRGCSSASGGTGGTATGGSGGGGAGDGGAGGINTGSGGGGGFGGRGGTGGSGVVVIRYTFQ